MKTLLIHFLFQFAQKAFGRTTFEDQQVNCTTRKGSSHHGTSNKKAVRRRFQRTLMSGQKKSAFIGTPITSSAPHAEHSSRVCIFIFGMHC